LIEITEAATRADRRRFLAYPYERNRADPHWTPPLRLSERDRLTPAKNPFFAHADVTLFLAWQSGVVAGRIAAIEDRLHNETHHENVAMFGFFEAANAAAGAALLAAVERWSIERGSRAVRGPLNPSLNESAGLLIEGFDSDPMLLMPHNPREYRAFIEGAGYSKAKDLYAWIYDLDRGVEPATAKIAARLRDRHRIIVRPLRVNEFDREVERLRLIYCGAWEHNWGFVPPTVDEFRRIARELQPIFDPRCAVCAEVDDSPVACAIAVPDVNQALKGTNGRLFPWGLIRLLGRRWIIDQIRLLILGVLPAYRPYGLYPVMLDALHRQVYPAYKRVECSWVLEDNVDVNGPLERAGARRYKTYRIFQKELR
jgi:hypothetical protein